MLVSSKFSNILRVRSKIIREIRKYFDENNFVEVLIKNKEKVLLFTTYKKGRNAGAFSYSHRSACKAVRN
jgi:lysyl-tRNA synthetase class II